MKRFAANRVCYVSTQTMLKNHVVEVDEKNHQVIHVFGLEEEIRQTEWLGGIILISADCPERTAGESFATYLQKIKSLQIEGSSLYAYHITAFNVNLMEFTTESRIICL